MTNVETVVVIEDHAECRELLRDALVVQGYRVLAASEGEQGIAFCRANPVSVVVTDILMPGKEGIELIVELRRDFSAIKVIAISGGGMISAEDCLALAKRAGAARVFKKPLAIAEVLEAVEQLCQESHCTAG